MDEYVGVDVDGERHYAGSGAHLLSAKCPCHPVEVEMKSLVDQTVGRGFCHTGTAEYDIASSKRKENSVA